MITGGMSIEWLFEAPPEWFQWVGGIGGLLSPWPGIGNNNYAYYIPDDLGQAKFKVGIWGDQ